MKERSEGGVPRALHAVRRHSSAGRSSWRLARNAPKSAQALDARGGDGDGALPEPPGAGKVAAHLRLGGDADEPRVHVGSETNLCFRVDLLVGTIVMRIVLLSLLPLHVIANELIS